MVTKQQLQSIDPYEFEELVADLWESKGYTTNVRKKSGDKAVDIDAERGGRKEVIQVKRYSDGNKIGSEEVRKYATLYQQTDANQVVLVTSGQFTSSARELADDLGVEIVDGRELSHQLSQNSISIRGSSTDLAGAKSESTQDEKDIDEVNITDSKLIRAIGLHIFGWFLIVILIAIIQEGLGLAEEGSAGFSLLNASIFILLGVSTAAAASEDDESRRVGTWILGIFYVFVGALEIAVLIGELIGVA